MNKVNTLKRVVVFVILFGVIPWVAAKLAGLVFQSVYPNVIFMLSELWFIVIFLGKDKLQKLAHITRPFWRCTFLGFVYIVGLFVLLLLV